MNILHRQTFRMSFAAGVVAFLTAGTSAFDLIKAKDGSGVFGYTDTQILPWCGYHVHDPDRPLPKRVDTGSDAASAAQPPSDAIVLFDGKDLSQWRPTTWKLVDGCLETTDGDLISKQDFGDAQIHVEWMAPKDFKAPWSNQGNNGVYVMGLYEVQIFDSWNVKIYPDGMAAAIYGQTPPLVNPCRPPGEWQTFDIIFTAPAFEGEKLVKPARVTMLYNGVLVHLNVEIHGETQHRALPDYAKKISKGPILLNGHNCPVRFRSIWVRQLSPFQSADYTLSTGIARPLFN